MRTHAALLFLCDPANRHVCQAERFLSGFPGLNGHLAALFLGRAGLTVDRLFALTLAEARALAPEADETQLVSGPHAQSWGCED